MASSNSPRPADRGARRWSTWGSCRRTTRCERCCWGRGAWCCRSGKKLGLDEGKVEEARKAVERVLRRRGLPLSEAQAAQLAACHDLETLERWLDLAITAANADEALR